MQNELQIEHPYLINSTLEKREGFLSGKLLIILISICSTYLFMFKFLGRAERIIELSGILLIVFSIVLYNIYYGNRERIPRMFNVHISLIFLFLLISAIAADKFHNQSLSLSLYEMKGMYYLLFYFLIHYLAPRPEWIKELIFWLAMIGSFLYIVQYFLYPLQITEAKMFIDRGTLRINLPGSIFRHFAFFLCVSEIFRKYSLKYTLGAVVLLLVAILSAYRSVLGLYVLIPSLYLLFNRKIRNRFLIILLGSLVLISSFFAFQGIFFEMQETFVRETTQGKENIRYRSAAYYLNDSQRNPAALITGNGAPSGHSHYGNRLIKISEYYGYYLSDIGIIGSIYKYGIIYAFIVVLILLRILRAKLPPGLHYVKLFIWMQVLLLFSTYPFWEDNSGIIALCLILYLIEYHHYAERLREKAEVSEKA